MKTTDCATYCTLLCMFSVLNSFLLCIIVASDTIRTNQDVHQQSEDPLKFDMKSIQIDTVSQSDEKGTNDFIFDARNEPAPNKYGIEDEGGPQNSPETANDKNGVPSEVVESDWIRLEQMPSDNNKQSDFGDVIVSDSLEPTIGFLDEQSHIKSTNGILETSADMELKDPANKDLNDINSSQLPEEHLRNESSEDFLEISQTIENHTENDKYFNTDNKSKDNLEPSLEKNDLIYDINHTDSDGVKGIFLDAIDNDLNIVESQIPTESPVTGDLNLTVEENPMPVFSEWAQKRIEEDEKQLEVDVVNATATRKNATSFQKQTILKQQRKNYASPDCGAKIIAANTDATGTSSVLSSTKDEYMLSPCNVRIWFVVELCEAIQAEHVELANFELFSSTPKNFSVSVSNRYPTNKWVTVGRFTAQDERGIQKFVLNPHLFGKYVRVDIHSHYNSEHFCPISLFRAFGTSEYEAFETEIRSNHGDDDDDDDNDDVKDGEEMADESLQKDQNIFKSASDAVITFVNKAASYVKPKSLNNNFGLATDSNGTDSICLTLNFPIICEKCNDNLRSQVNTLLTCKLKQLTSLLDHHVIRNSIYQSDVCAKLVGLDLRGCNNDRTTTEDKDYVEHLFPTSYIVAMCNLLAIIDRSELYTRIPPNVTIYQNNNLTINEIPTNILDEKVVKQIVVDEKHEFLEQDINSPNGNMISLTEPNENSIEILASSSEEAIDSKDICLNGEPCRIGINNQQQNIENYDSKLPLYEEAVNSVLESSSVETIDKLNENIENAIDDIFPAIIEPEQNVVQSVDSEINEYPANGHQPGQKVQTESVFLRLSNRVKALERNMSLSGQYLEELSRRYKKQVEELQLSFAKTLHTIEEQTKRSLEREQKLIDQNEGLRNEISHLNDTIFSLPYIFVYCCCFGVINFLIIYLMIRIWLPRKINQYFDCNLNRAKVVKNAIRRRISIDNVGQTSSTKQSSKQRRPSEEALPSTYRTYSELLLDEEDVKTFGSELEEYDNFSDTANKKPSKSKNRNAKLPNGKRAVSLEPLTKRKKQFSRQGSAPANIVSSEECKTNKNVAEFDQPVLDNDYEIYGCNTDYSYNEFMPDGPSGEKAQLDNLKGNSSNDTQKEPKTRRLSSPAFLKSPFLRYSSKNKSHELSTGWEWTRRKNKEAGKNLNNTDPLIIHKSSRTNGSFNNSNSNSVETISSRESTRTESTTNSGISIGEKSDKKRGSLRRIFKKVF